MKYFETVRRVEKTERQREGEGERVRGGVRKGERSHQVFKANSISLWRG